MRPVLGLLAYCLAVVLGGALLAPPLYWLGQWAIAIDLVPQLRPFPFARYLNRAVYVLALGLLWPTLRWLGLRRWDDLRLRKNPHGWRDLAGGLALGAGGLTTVGLAQVACGP